MKSTLNKILIVSMIFILSGSVLADPVNPVGSGRVPPSSGRSRGLRRSPNPIDSSGNNIITGNISGDKYFRGSVPYNSTTNFGGTSSSSSVDNFLRRSSGSSVYNYSTGRYKPYYSSSNSVSTIRPGRSSVFKAPSFDFSGRTATGTVATDSSPAIKSVNPDLQLFSNQVRPIQLNSEEMRRNIEIDLDTRFKNLQTESIETDQRVKEVNPDLAKAKENVEELKTRIREKELKRLDGLEPKEVSESKYARKLSETEVLAEKISSNEYLDVYDQMKMEVAGLGQMLKAKQQAVKQTLSQEEVLEESKKDPSPEKIVVEAKTHKTLAAYKDDNFNKHLRLAEEYLKEGKYYRAVSAYSLAEIYKPGDPIVYAGKSQALFAAGEFMSSAYYLSEAISIFPEIVKIKIDIVAIVGDKDVLESRASTVEEFIEQFDSVELKYLLSYVYYQMGRLERAKELIDDAYESNPDLEAVAVIKAEIDRNLN